MNFDLDDGIAILERTPATFRALLTGLSDAWIAANEGPDTFSAFDNLGHLIHGERTDWIPRARIIHRSERSRFASCSPRGWPMTSDTSRRPRG